MQSAVPRGEGAIAAVLGLDDATVEEVCADASADGVAGVWAVNYNAPGQVVIAGKVEAVARATAIAGVRGARRVLPLPMSVPVHCQLMAPAAERFEAVLSDIELRAPKIPVVHNADLERHAQPEEIRKALVRQLTCPVRWASTIDAFTGHGARTLVEVGPGRVLTGLARRINRNLRALSLHDSRSFDSALAELV